MSNNKRIAQNTLLLYVRMLFMIAVSLYTSRVVLNVLGVEDFGIYNVVGGIVTMLGFVQNSMAAATQRYLTFELGKNDMAQLSRVFSTAVVIHVIIAIGIILLAETIGLWFFMHKMQIPESRMYAAFWVYQCSIITFVTMIVSTPYNAVIIAHEKMKAFAYISILEAVLKLAIVYVLLISLVDKLILYAALLLIVQLVIRVCYTKYCTGHFEESKMKWVCDKKIMKDMFSFMGWTLNGNLAVVGFTQGLNIVLNMFFGPAVNAARGVAVQVQGTIQRFCISFQLAVNPQMTKAYAQGEYVHMHELLIVSSKFSFFLLLFLSIPVMLEADVILHVWLGTVPEHTVSFLRLVLCVGLLTSLSNPIINSVHAVGVLKKFQLIEGSMLLLIVPVAYLLLKLYNMPPECVFVVHIVIEICTQCTRLHIVLPMIHLKKRDYGRQVLVPILRVGILCPIIPLILYKMLDDNVTSFFIVCFVGAMSTIVAIYSLGCTTIERNFIKAKIIGLMNK